MCNTAKLGEYGDKLATMTAQEVFDVAAKHLLTQNKKSIANGACRYDGANGLCCAAAPFIKSYSEDLEGMCWTVLASGGYADQNHEYLIQDLQELHDGNSVEAWLYELSKLATEYNLNQKVLEAFDV